MADRTAAGRKDPAEKGQGKGIGYTVALTFAAVVLVIGIFTALRGAGSSPLFPKDKDGDGGTEDLTPAWEGVILKGTSDAGEEYIDDTLFVGDGNFLRFVETGILTYNNVIGLEGKGIQSAVNEKCVYFDGYDEPVTVSDAVRLMHPKRVLMNFGTHNLSGVPENFIYVYRRAIDSIMENYPYADIIIMSIPPLGEDVATPYGELTIGAVEGFNDALKTMCAEGGIPFLNVYEVLTDPSTGYAAESMTDADGIHLTAAGLQRVISYCRTHALITEDRRPFLPDGPIQVGMPSSDGKFDCNGMLAIATRRLSTDGYKFSSVHLESSDAVKEYRFTVGSDAAPGTESEYAGKLCEFVKEKCGSNARLNITWSDSENGEHVFSIREIEECETHTYGDWIVTAAATCSAEGRRVRTCKVCGHTEEETIPKDDDAHDIRWKVISQPTTESRGEELGTCSRCGKQWTRYTAKLDGGGSGNQGQSDPGPSGQTEPDTPVNPDNPDNPQSLNCYQLLSNVTARLASAGYNMTASGDGTTVTENTYSYTVPAEAVDSSLNQYSNELYDFISNRCSKDSMISVSWYDTDSGAHVFTITERTVCTEHQFGNWETIEIATCSKEGKRKHKCTVCGFEEEVTYGIDPTNHTYDWEVITDATCTQEGEKKGTCSGCGTILYDYIEAKGHDWVTTIEGYDATCTEDGCTSQIECSVCGEVQQYSETIPAYGHDYYETTDDEGNTIHVCSRCGDSYAD